MKKHFLLILIVTLFTILTKAQQIVPTVGQPMPDFELNDVHYLGKKRVTLADFKEKWLILDFFTQNCLACFASFPKMDKLREEFKDQIQFVLVGDNEHKYGKNVRSIFERIRKKQNLELSVAYDSVTFKRWKITSVPYLVVIDDKGIVRAINNSQDINSKNLRGLMAKRDDSSAFRNIAYESWNVNHPFLTNGNGGADTAFSFRSLLSNWKRPTAFMHPSSITSYNKEITGVKGFQISGATVQGLYSMAYLDRSTVDYGDPSYGKTSRLPLVINIDSSDFVSDSKTGKNLYNYSLCVPADRATVPYIMEVMQRDLKNYFDYDANIETRKMPYWKLIATNDGSKKLNTKGKTYYMSNGPSGLEFGNYPISKLLYKVWVFHQKQPPFIDETGINGNVDIKLNVLMTDFEDIKRGLKKSGLELVRAEKDMQVLVIRKPDPVRAGSAKKTD